MKFRHLSIALATALSMTSPLLAESAPALHVNITSQSLSSSLGEFAKQAKLQLIVDSKLLEGKKAPALQGDMSLPEALSKLLKGTGLEATIQDDKMVIKAKNEAEVALDAITIHAAQAPSEETKSYTISQSKSSTGLSLSLRDTPQSMSVVTRERIEDQKLESMNDVVNSVTGLSVEEFDSSRFVYFARGFEINGVQIDGLPNGTKDSWGDGREQMDTIIYDRVEVVRGATGLLNGTGDPSASINFVRKRADSKTFKGSVEASAGSWDDYRESVDVSTPVNESGSVRARVVGMHQQSNSYVDLLSDEKNVFYGVLEADLSDSTLFDIGMSYQENSPQGSTWGGLPAWFSNGVRTDWGSSKTTAADWTYWNSTQATYFTDLEHTFANNVKIKSGLSYMKNTSDTKLLYLYNAPDMSTGLGLDAWPASYMTDRKQYDGYTNISAPFTLFDREHEFIVGGRYSQQKFSAQNKEITSFDSVGNFYDWDGSYAEPIWGNTVFYETYEKKELGAYTAVRLNITDQLKFILGSRVTNWQISGLTASSPDSYHYEHNGVVVPYAGVVYDLTENYSVYASYADIFNPQSERDINGKYLDPLRGKTYEVGVKGEFFDGALNSSVALFEIHQDNLAQATGNFVTGTTAEVAYEAVNGAKSQGYEIDIAGKILPDWDVSLGWSQFVAEDSEGEDVNTNHPRKTLKLFTKYRLPGELNKLSVGGGVNWESRRYVATTDTLNQNVILQQDPYSIVNLMARYEFTKQFSGQLNVNNVFDKAYYTQFGFYNQLSYGAPLNAKLSFKYTF